MLNKRLVKTTLLYRCNNYSEKENALRTQSNKNSNAVFLFVNLCVFSVLLWLIKENELRETNLFILMQK
jgi:hypothetical protein